MTRKPIKVPQNRKPDAIKKIYVNANQGGRFASVLTINFE